METERLFYELFPSHRGTAAKLIPVFLLPSPGTVSLQQKGLCCWLMVCTRFFAGANELKKEHRGKAGWELFPARQATHTQSQIALLATGFLLQFDFWNLPGETLWTPLARGATIGRRQEQS